MKTKLEESGFKAVFAPHPYIAPEFTDVKKIGAVAFSRLDWDKNTHIIAEANQDLDPKKRVQIYGSENTLYTHHKIDKDFPNWRSEYKGKFHKGFTAAYDLAASSNFVVDLSVISGDGGGTQYTFLEAWAAKSHLIIHSSWLSDKDNTMKDGSNCTSVSNATELSKLLKSKASKEIKEKGYSMLKNHEPKAVVPIYEQALSHSSTNVSKVSASSNSD